MRNPPGQDADGLKFLTTQTFLLEFFFISYITKDQNYTQPLPTPADNRSGTVGNGNFLSRT